MMDYEITLMYHFHNCVSRSEPRFVLPRELVDPLERELCKQAGHLVEDNHVCYVFHDGDENEIAVWFHDFGAFFCRHSDLNLTGY